MKKQKTNKANKFVTGLILTLVLFFPYFVFAATQQDLDSKKAQQRQAQALADQKAKEAEQMKSQIKTVDNQISQTENAIAKTAEDISLVKSAIEDLKVQISDQESKLQIEKEKLNEIVSQWYMDGDFGFVEVVIGSDSLSDLISKQEYYDSTRQHMNGKIEKINEMKTKLLADREEQQKKMIELQNIQDQQTAYKKSAENQLSWKNHLLNMTESQQKEYLDLVSKLQKDIAHISAELYAQRRAYGSGTAGALGYPYMQPPGVYVLDPWNFYMSECTGYAAWYWNSVLGKRWLNTRPGSGSAWNWPALARDQGYSVSDTPRVGAIISWQASSLTSQWGHVAIVQGVNSDGTINISEYNWTYNHGGDTRNNVRPGDYGSYSYIW